MGGLVSNKNLVSQRGTSQEAKVLKEGFPHGGGTLVLEVTMARTISSQEWRVTGLPSGPMISAERTDNLLARPQLARQT